MLLAPSRSLADLNDGTFFIFMLNFLFFKAGIDKCTCVSGGLWPIRFSGKELHDLFFRLYHQKHDVLSDDLSYSGLSGKEVVTGVSIN